MLTGSCELTTTSSFPYSQNASSVLVPQDGGLPPSYNYVRNSVKLVVNAYSGKMTFYAMDQDPILRTYEAAFPQMFTPAAQMPADVRAHLRYPEDMFAVQTALYGRYHLSAPQAFYNASGAWSLSPTAGAGSPTQSLAVTLTTNSRNQLTGSIAPMSPLYQVLQPPGSDNDEFTISDAYVPFNPSGASQNLSAFMLGTYGTSGGNLHIYVTGGGQSVGPALAEAEIQQNNTVSQEITLLDHTSSSVLLGNVLMVPVGNAVIYVRPLYVESTGNPEPELNDVITVLGQNVQIQPTIGASLTALLNTPVSSPGTSGPQSPTLAADAATKVNQLLAEAQADYEAAQAALKGGSPNALAQYQSEVDAMDQVIQQAASLMTPAGAKAPAASPAPKSAPSQKKASKPLSAAVRATPPGVSG
ncbi:MAG: UPF0182 family protein [Acidimicrobiales bacterium]